MQNDKTTLHDLSVFTADGNGGVFALIDRTVTSAGKGMLRKHIQQPPDNYERLTEIQEAIKFWSAHPDLWPTIISNGTLVMLDKFFESAGVSTPPGNFLAFFQKLLNRQEYFFTQFSLSHLSD